MKRGGGGTEKGEVTGSIGGGWEDEGFAPDCEFLSVEFDEPLVETPSLGQTTSSFSSPTSDLATSSCFSSLIFTSSFTFNSGRAKSSDNFAFEDLGSVFWLLRSLDNGRVADLA